MLVIGTENRSKWMVGMEGFFSLPNTNMTSENQFLEDEISFWDGQFSGAMLVSGRVFFFKSQVWCLVNSLREESIFMWWFQNWLMIFNPTFVEMTLELIIDDVIWWILYLIYVCQMGWYQHLAMKSACKLVKISLRWPAEAKMSVESVWSILLMVLKSGLPPKGCRNYKTNSL